MSTPTTKEILRAIFDRNVKAYEEQLIALGRAMPKKTRETLIDGFKDGQTAMRRELESLGLFHIVDATTGNPVVTAEELEKMKGEKK